MPASIAQLSLAVSYFSSDFCITKLCWMLANTVQLSLVVLHCPCELCCMLANAVNFLCWSYNSLLTLHHRTLLYAYDYRSTFVGGLELLLQTFYMLASIAQLSLAVSYFSSDFCITKLCWMSANTVQLSLVVLHCPCKLC